MVHYAKRLVDKQFLLKILEIAQVHRAQLATFGYSEQ